MTYAGPSPEAAFDLFAREGISRVIVLPMFPQYSSSTAASVYDAIQDAASTGRSRRFVPALAFVAPYFDRNAYIHALCDRLRSPSHRV